MKDVGIRIRVANDLREAFSAVCHAEGQRASDVLREFMQSYVERHQSGQGELFSAPSRRSLRKRQEHSHDSEAS